MKDMIEQALDAYLDSEEYQRDLAIETRWYQEEYQNIPSWDFLESVLIARKREQLEKEM